MSDFWSRRKAAVLAEERAEIDADEACRAARREAELAERSDAEILEELGLPDPDTISGGEQVQAFLKAQVPQRLKNRALRALWRSNPVLANLDGLVDYADDYSGSSRGVEVKTAYVVGKGLLRAITAEAHVPEPEPEVEPVEVPPEVAEAAQPLSAPPIISDDPQPARPRRMRFDYSSG